MFCNQCGKQIPDDAKFCHHCGSSVGIEIEKEPEVQVQTEEPVQPVKKKEKKARKVAPVGKKKLILAVVAVIAVVAIVILGVNMIKNHQDVLAELPDPEYYFANGPIDEVNEHDDVKQVILRSNENLWDEAAAYVNLLKWSGKYPVTQSDEERYSSGDYMWNFVYNNRDDIKSPYFCQVEVNYYNKSNGRDVYAVWITMHDTDAFDLVQKETYEEPTQTETTPSVDYSGVGGDNDASAGNSDSGTTTESPAVSDTSDSIDYSVEEDDDDDSGYEVPDVADIYDNPTPCGVCDGDGDCGTCGGDGYLHSSASDEEDRNCYSCSGSGNCKSCGGDGEL